MAAGAEVMAANDENFSTITVCPGVILGPTNKSAGSAQLLFLAQKGLPFVASGGSGYVDVRDVCRAMLALMESNLHAERFVVVGENITLHRLFALLSKGFGKRTPMLLPNWAILWAGSLAGTYGKLIGKTMPFDRQMAQTSINKTAYSSQKLIDAVGFSFTPIEDSIAYICNILGCR